MPALGPSRTTWLLVVAAITLDGCAALVAGLLPEAWLGKARRSALPFAAGMLLGTTFLDLLPEACAQLPPAKALAVTFAGAAAMLVLEWTIGHRLGSSSRRRSAAGVLLGADALHNAADGAAIAAAFLASPHLGLVTALAVIVHEVPEEVAAYVVLREAGMSRARAVLVMTGVQLTAAFGAAAALVGASFWRAASGVALALSAGTFLHVAEVDLAPRVLPDAASPRQRAVALVTLLAGLAVAIAGAAR
ncbi:MAG TPA: ZIP family metal transporter [Polyangia bacterium]|nr:ZIP family metal transporter [Polyangia bacterium]